MKFIRLNDCLSLENKSFFEKRFVWAGSYDSFRDYPAEAKIAKELKVKEPAKADAKEATDEAAAQKTAEGTRAVGAGMGDLKVFEQSQIDKAKAEGVRVGMGDVKLAEAQQDQREKQRKIVGDADRFLKNKVDSQAITRDQYSQLLENFVMVALDSSTLKQAAEKVYAHVSKEGPTREAAVVLELINRETPKSPAPEKKEKAPLTPEQRLAESLAYINKKDGYEKVTKEQFFAAIGIGKEGTVQDYVSTMKSWQENGGLVGDARVGKLTWDKLKPLLDAVLTAPEKKKEELPPLAIDISKLQEGQLVRMNLPNKSGKQEINGEKLRNGQVVKIVKVEKNSITVETSRGNQFMGNRGEGAISLIDRSKDQYKEVPEKFAAAQKRHVKEKNPETSADQVARVTREAKRSAPGRSSSKSE